LIKQYNSDEKVDQNCRDVITALPHVQKISHSF